MKSTEAYLRGLLADFEKKVRLHEQELNMGTSMSHRAHAEGELAEARKTIEKAFARVTAG